VTTDVNSSSSDNNSETETESVSEIEDNVNLYNLAIEQLKNEVKSNSHNEIESARLNAILFYLRLIKCGEGKTKTSVTVAKATRKNIYRARFIRAWILNYLQNGTLPVSRQGKHLKTRNLTNYINDEMNEFGFEYSEVKKSMYMDGHEQADVLAYRKLFLERMVNYEKKMISFSGENIEIETWPDVNQNSDDLVNQVVKRAILIFKAHFLGTKALFAFDNATSHAAYTDNALVANNMNLSPGGKQAKMRQDMCFPMDYKIPELREEPKGLREILKERKLWHDEMKLKCKGGCEEGSINCYARTAIANQPDFKAQRRKLEETIILAGHEVIFYPKFHCELNYIENFWGSAKRYLWSHCDYTWEGLKKTVLQALASVPLSEIRRYIDAYRKGLTSEAAKYAVKKYQSHRRIPDSILFDIN
ncbi:31646_t:CDS:2, partial [Racocetra persica]